MKIKRLILLISAALLLCGGASADYLQIADEAAVGGSTSAGEMLDYVYASGAARDPAGELRRLYIWDYFLNIEKEKLGLERGVYEYAYESLNPYDNMDYLPDKAYGCAMEANDILAELDRNESYLSRLTEGDEKAERMAAALTSSERQGGLGAAGWIAALAVAAAAAAAVMIFLSQTARRGLRSMVLRDLRRSLLKARWAILAVGLCCALIAAALSHRKVENAFPPIPDAGGEYILAAESLMEYCGEIASANPSIAVQARNVMRYQLSSAMGDILNDCVVINPGDTVTYYRSRAERLRAESEALNTAAWQTCHNAADGPKDRYAVQMETYMEQALEAQLRMVDADYCDNIAGLLEKGGLSDPAAPARIGESLDSAKKALKELTAPKSEPGRPYVAELISFAAGILAAAVLAAALELLRLAFRRRAQQRAVSRLQNADEVELINFRG